MTREGLFTSKSVAEGHPNKVADRIFDACLTGDPWSRVAGEVPGAAASHAAREGRTCAS